MSRKHRSFGAVLASIVLVSLLVSFLPGSIAEAWSTDPTVNTAVCTLPQYQDRPVMVADGSGGAIIAWQDGRGSGYGWDIYAQRLSSAGIPQWTDNGMAVYAGAGNQWYPAIADDGSGGAIIVWNDSRTGTGAVYAQRVNSAGVLQWTASGIALCTSANYTHSPLAVGDGSGGAVIAWVDWCSTTNCYLATVYAQRVNSAGQPQWTANGVSVCTMVSGSEYPRPGVAMTGDGTGGAIVTWQDYGGDDWNIRAQRVSSAGARQWTDGGISVCAALGKDWHPAIASDGAAGAIITWVESQGGSICDVRAQRVNSAGVCQWVDNGVVVSAADGYEGSRPTLVTDGAGGAIIAWSSPYYNGVYGFGHIYAQRLASTGTTLWGGDPAAVCTYPCDQFRPVAVSDCLGGAIIAWHDDRSHHPPPPGWASPEVYDIYAQRVDSAGAMLWADNGTAVCRSAQHRSPPALATDGSGAVILAWNDQRTEGAQNEHIYAQRVTALGDLGGPSNQAPAAPSNVSPTGTEVSLTPTLQSSAFSDPDAGDTHAASQWQIRTSAGSYSSPIYDSGSTASSLTSVAVPPGILSYSTTYYWHVRHKDNQGSWSDWSTETSFTTAASPNHPPAQPVNVAPTDAATIANLTPTLSSSASSDPDAGDTQGASQWQIRTSSGNYSSPIFDSGTDTANLTSIAVSSGVLGYSSTYHWRVRHQDNHAAWSEWSTETSFMTPPPPIPGDTTPPAAVADLATSSATTNSVTLTWTAPGDDINAGTALTYDIRYSTATITGANWGAADQCSGEPAPGVAGTAQTFTVTGLSPDTTYYFAMKTADEVPNWSGLSNVANRKTETPQTSPPTVSTSAATLIGHSSATLNASLTGLGTASSVEVSFEWGLTASYGSTTTPQNATNPAAFSSAIGGLAPSTTYHFRAKAVGDSTVFGDDLTFATLSAASPLITTSAASGIGITSATLNGDLADLGIADNVTVSFVWGTEAGGPYTQETTGQAMTSIGTFSTGLSGLVPGTTYYYRAKAQGGAAPVYGDEMSFTTSALPNQSPTQPSNILPANAATGVTLTPTLTTSAFSDPDSADTHAASQWQVTTTPGNYSSPVFDSATDTANLTTISIPSGVLAYSTTYYWHVRHQNNHSVWSSWSTESGFTSLPPSSPPSVSTLAATGISATAAMLNGSLTSLSTADNAWACFEWGLTDSYGNTTTMQGPIMWAPGTWSYPLSGLTPGTTYHFRAKADGDGGAAHGSDMTFTTGQIPEVEDVDPSSGKRNQDLTVTISGSHLDGAMAVSFGSGITVEDFSVNSSTEITAEITIDADATLGDRDVSVTTEWGTATKTGAFSVVGGGGGICGAGAPTMPNQGSEMTTMLAALGLLFGVGYVLVRRGMRNRRDSVRA